MTDSLQILLNALEKSIEKNGDKPLTLSHLANLIKVAQRVEERHEYEKDLYQAYGDMY